MTERTRAEQESAQLKGKNYKWAKFETYHFLQTLLLLLIGERTGGQGGL